MTGDLLKGSMQSCIPTKLYAGKECRLSRQVVCLLRHRHAYEQFHLFRRSNKSRFPVTTPVLTMAASSYEGGRTSEARRGEQQKSEKRHGIIRSQNNQKVKHCVKLLKSKSYREEHAKVMLCGAKVVEELGPYFPEISSIFYIGDVDDDEMMDHHSPYMRDLLGFDDEGSLQGNRGVTYKVTKQVMEKLCRVTTASPNMVAVEVDMPRYQDFSSYEPGTIDRLLVLERCQDPGNLGSLLRSAVAFGFDGVMLLPGCADPFGDKSIRASRGASFRIPMMLCENIQDWLMVCKRHDLIALAADVMQDDGLSPGHDQNNSERNSFQQDQIHVSLVVGSEGQGLSDEMREHCRLVSIPMSDDMESLNVATAASILMCLLSPAGAAMQNRLLDALVSQ